MLRTILVIALIASIATVVVDGAKKRHTSSAGFEKVTCGSMIKLTNAHSGVKLHSHEVKYGSGSQQQSVTGKPNSDDPNSFWLVRGQNGQFCERGAPIKCNSVIRLQHQSTKRNLHSHNFRSPLSSNQEVSAFGEHGNGDVLDNWKVECNSAVWLRDDPVRFKHVQTGKYLHSTGRHQFGRPINGQSEICAFSGARNENLWIAEEGVYIATQTED